MVAAVDSREVAKFEAMAAAWWDPKGEAAPLHAMNPCRLDYIAAQIAAQFDRDRRAPRPFAGLSVLDVGCGGGLATEPMARLGATATGIDASETGIAVAKAHAARSGLDIAYRVATAEALGAEGASFDAVLALEIVEHTPDPAAFLRAVAALVRPGGIAILSTVNRTALSFATAIVAAEWVLRWLPRGTHDWRRFLTPDELAAHAAAAGLDPVDSTGMIYDPFRGDWRLGPSLAANYLLAAVKPG